MRLSIALAMCTALSVAQAQQPWTLEQCVQRAEEKNLAVLNAGLDAELADETKDQALWDLAPSLNGVATHGYNYGRVVDRFTNTFSTDRVRTNNFYLSSTVVLFQGLQKQGMIKRTELDATAAKQGMEAARNAVRLEVVQACLDVLTITYSHTSLGPQGDVFVASFTEAFYEKFMREWETQMNHYLVTGEAMKAA